MEEPLLAGPKLPKWVQPGASFKYNFGAENTYTGREFHIRAIVDGQAVIREWKDSSGWSYTVEGPYYFGPMGNASSQTKPQRRLKRPNRSAFVLAAALFAKSFS